MHPLDKLIIKLEKAKPGYTSQKDLALVAAAYTAVSSLIRDSSLDLSVLMDVAGINSQELGNTSQALFAIEAFLDVNSRK